MGCCNFSNANGMELEENEFDNFNGNGMLDFEGEVEDGEELDDNFEGDDEFDELDDDYDEFGKKFRARRKRKKELKAQGLSNKEARKQARREIGKKGVYNLGYDPVEKAKAKAKAVNKAKKQAEAEAVFQQQQKAMADPSLVEGGIAGGVGSPITMDSLGAKPKPTFASAVKKYWWVGGIAIVLIGGYFAFGKKLGIRK